MIKLYIYITTVIIFLDYLMNRTFKRTAFIIEIFVTLLMS